MPALSQISIESADFSRYKVTGEKDTSENILAELSQVNFFVGPNNSGKSRFLRELAKTKSLRFAPKADFSALTALNNEFREEINSLINERIEVSGFREKANSLTDFAFINENNDYGQPLRELIDRAAKAEATNLSIQTSGFSHGDHSHYARRLKALGERMKAKAEPIFGQLPQIFKFERIYIPTLRGLRRFKQAEDCYDERTRGDYFGNGEAPQIFTGLSLYNQIQDLLLGDLAARELVSRFQTFLSNAFFDRQPVALIPRKQSDVLYIKIGEEEELPVFELGDGIQMIIIITFPLFRLNNIPALIFIEEPELYLHPGLQRVLVRTLTSFSNYEYFIATHSNHLLDLSLDFDSVSIFTFHKELEASDKLEKKAHFRIERVSSQDHRTLQILGIRNSSVFLSNCTIWVEGITDRRYLSHYLNLYLIHLRETTKSGETPFLPKEDLHYSFVEYAGSNITHWSFLDEIDDPIEVENLCAKLFLITDKDSPSNQGKVDRHTKLQEKLGERYYCLNCREIENLVAPNILRSIVGTYEGSTEGLREFKYADYCGKPLGKFIETKVIQDRTRKGSYSADSGTVSDKLGFCQRAITQISNFTDMTEEAQTLTKLIYNFIKKMNLEKE